MKRRPPWWPPRGMHARGVQRKNYFFGPPSPAAGVPPSLTAFLVSAFTSARALSDLPAVFSVDGAVSPALMAPDFSAAAVSALRSARLRVDLVFSTGVGFASPALVSPFLTAALVSSFTSARDLSCAKVPCANRATAAAATSESVVFIFMWTTPFLSRGNGHYAT